MQRTYGQDSSTREKEKVNFNKIKKRLKLISLIWNEHGQFQVLNRCRFLTEIIESTQYSTETPLSSVKRRLQLQNNQSADKTLTADLFHWQYWK